MTRRRFISPDTSRAHHPIAAIAEAIEPRLLLSVVGRLFPSKPPAPLPVRTDTNIDAAWRFHEGDVANAQAASFDDSSWTPLSLPHTWNALDGQDGGDNYYRGTGWYRRHYTVPSQDAGKELFLQFDGASMVADVYVNGTLLGEHAGGFTTFRFDATSYLRVGQDNVLAVKVSNAPNPDVPPLYADFTFDGGIYRDVHLLATSKVHIDEMYNGSPGVLLEPTNVSIASARLRVATRIRNDSAAPDNVAIRSLLMDESGHVVKGTWSVRQVAANSTLPLTQSMFVSRPHLWNGRTDPYTYTVAVEIIDGAGVRDVVRQPVGFRAFRIDPAKGFFLNGHGYDLHGVDMHQDWLNEGWAVSQAQVADDISLVEELGATAVRLSHYPYAQQVYDSFDRDGIVVWTEIPNITYITPSVAFADNVKQQLRELILQNFNHPSVFFWGMFNEMQPSATADPNPLIGQLVALAHSLDPTRLTTSATNQPIDDTLNFHSDLLGLNEYYGWYNGQFSDFGSYTDDVHRRYPTRPLAISEYGAGASIYQHTDQPGPPTIGPLWYNEGHWHPEEYQNLFHESYWEQIKQRPYLWAKFVWNLHDYATDFRDDGDTPGRNDKGLVTYDRQTKKDAFYFYQANWSSAPVLYITDRRFTARTNPLTQVKVYSNLGAATLYVNGVSQGAVKSNDEDVLTWPNIKLSPGNNAILVTAPRGGAVYTDSCNWTLS